MESLELKTPEEAIALFGTRDERLKLIERRAGVRVHHRNGNVTISGPEENVGRAAGALRGLLKQMRSGRPLHPEDVSYALLLATDEEGGGEYTETRDLLLTDNKSRPIRPRTPNQRAYVNAMETNDLVFGIGPAGTGKTYLAVAMAVKRLVEQRVDKIIVARPAVEAGEKLGFLPGDFQQKVDPYLRPVYDALFGMMRYEKASRLMERGVVEVAPLAYMRGRTLDNAFVILDEAQNTTVEQMKMFLTRLGRTSCAVVNGDVTQIDLPRDRTSGLVDAEGRLRGVKGIAFAHFSSEDVVRHDLVARIIVAYERGERKEPELPGLNGENDTPKETD